MIDPKLPSTECSETRPGGSPPGRRDTVFLDSFTGSAAHLPKGKRTPENVLAALRRDPRVSTWDMDQTWLRQCLAHLKAQGKITNDRTESYPWLRFIITETPND